MVLTIYLGPFASLAEVDTMAGSDLNWGLASWLWLVGVATVMVDILRLTGVGRAVGRTAFVCSGRQLPAEGVRGSRTGF